jgi:hypothetical protein
MGRLVDLSDAGDLVVTGNGASFVIGAVLVGPAAPFGSHGGRSAIVKRPAAGPVRVGSCGIAGDE